MSLVSGFPSNIARGYPRTFSQVRFRFLSLRSGATIPSRNGDSSMTQSSLLRPKSSFGPSGFEKFSTVLLGRIYNSDGFSMRVPLRLEAKRASKNHQNYRFG